MTALILLVILESSTYNAAYAYGTQISIFAALAAAFAAWGVDQNIYSHFAAQQATGAGWLILAIIDLLWIVFFTSPPQSPVFSIVDSLAASRARPRPNKVEKIERSTDAFASRRQESRQNSGDAFALSHLHGGGGGSTRGDVRASRGSGPPRLPDQQNPRVTGGDWALYTPPQKSGGRGTITSITSEPKSATASGRVKSVAEESRESGRTGIGRPESGRAGSGSAGPDEALSQNIAAESPKAQWKAEALFPCMCFVLRGSFLTEFCV